MNSEMFNFWNNKHTLIQSQLVRCDLSELDMQMNNDNQLKELLTTPASKLPKKYHYLLAELFDGWEEKTLYELIKSTVFSYKKIKSYFSKSGDKITGWCAYEVNYDRILNSDVVTELKMFSFDLDKLNVTLMRDLKTLLDNLLEQYPLVSWAAIEENDFNDSYRYVLKTYNELGYKTSEYKDNKGVLIYTIQRKEK